MNRLDELTPQEVDRFVSASRRLLAECRRFPSPVNTARLETQLGLLETLRRAAPDNKKAKIARLAGDFLAAIPPSPPRA